MANDVFICPDHYAPFHLHNELAYQIKLSIRPSTRADPDVRIEFPFDGGLQQVGKLVKSSRGHDIYTIRRYSTLDPLLGQQWHLRVLNRAKDFSYVILETVQYYLHRRVPAQDAIDDERSVDGGYLLVIWFVRGDAVERNWEDNCCRLDPYLLATCSIIMMSLLLIYALSCSYFH